MIGNILDLLSTKGPVTFAKIGKSHTIKALRRRTLNARHNISVHESANIHRDTEFGTDGEITIHSDCQIRKGVVLAPSGGRIDIGPDSLINVFGTLLGQGSIRFGTGVLVGPHTTIVAANHTFDRRDVPIADQEITEEGIEINDDVWIGANCVILDGVVIGEGAVIAAGSVVTESVPEYAVMAGIPAEKVATRGE